MPLAAGYLSAATGRFRRVQAATHAATMIYCAKGSGWMEANGALDAVRAGDLVVLLASDRTACGAHASAPWTIHWVEAAGDNLSAYLQELGASRQAPVVRVGEDPQLTRLFGEIRQALEQGPGFPSALRGSHALAYLLATLIWNRHHRRPRSPDKVQRVAQAIIYMSEHLDEPLRVTALARLASLSTAHFSVLFKEQTGCSPRDYLHLLRIHQACGLLQDSALSIKEVASQVGYADPFHFSRQFKAFEGVSPTEYRESNVPSS